MSSLNKYAATGAAAGFLLYKYYKDGTLGKIFNHGSDDNNSPNSIAAQPQPDIINTKPADTIHGNSPENITFDPDVYQFYNDTCAIKSQQLVLQQFGINVSQEELIDIAKMNGWYAEGYGTPMNMVGKLLEHYGVGVKATDGNNIFNISNELAQGHQVIVGVDEMELIDPNGQWWVDTIKGQQANHALVVSGIDTSDPDNVKVIITDPGTGNKLMEYPADQFIDAWKDSNCFMVSTDSVPTAAPLYPYQPITQFGGIPTYDLGQLAGMDIDTEQHDLYDKFVNDLLDGHANTSDLMNDYSQLLGSDDTDTCDDPDLC